MELSEGPNEKADAKEKHRKEKKKNEEEKKIYGQTSWGRMDLSDTEELSSYKLLGKLL